MMKSRLWDISYNTGKRFKVIAKTIEDAIKKSREALPPEMSQGAYVVSINAICEIDVA